MAEKNLRRRIKEAAAERFNAGGYFGTSIRDIAGAVDCSLPMIYYYYKNKKELFDEIIKKDFFELVRRQASLLKIDNVVDFYTDFVYSLNALSGYDRQAYRLGIKVYLSFDGDEELMAVMDDWEKGILPRHREILAPYLKGAENAEAVARALVHMLETLIQSIVVKNRYLPREEIREEIAVLLRGCV